MDLYPGRSYGSYDGDLKQMNGCRIGVADGSYQKDLLEKWLDSNQIHAEVVACKGYDE